jgi:hypothetical protein
MREEIKEQKKSDFAVNWRPELVHEKFKNFPIFQFSNFPIFQFSNFKIIT